MIQEVKERIDVPSLNITKTFTIFQGFVVLKIPFCLHSEMKMSLGFIVLGGLNPWLQAFGTAETGAGGHGDSTSVYRAL